MHTRSLFRKQSSFAQMCTQRFFLDNTRKQLVVCSNGASLFLCAFNKCSILLCLKNETISMEMGSNCTVSSAARDRSGFGSGTHAWPPRLTTEERLLGTREARVQGWSKKQFTGIKDDQVKVVLDDSIQRKFWISAVHDSCQSVVSARHRQSDDKRS